MGRALHLLTDTVTIASLTGRSDYGDPAYGALLAIKARVENETKMVIDQDGNERQANHKIVTESEVKISDRVWLPGDNIALVNDARRPVTTRDAATPGGYRLYETWL